MNTIPPPPYKSENQQNKNINEITQNDIDFSINPYLVPYPEQEIKTNITITDSILNDSNDKDVIDGKSDPLIESTHPIEPEIITPTPDTSEKPVDLVNDPEPTQESVALPEITSPTSEEPTTKSTSNNQQLESIKKSLEFFTHGCHNFFLFKSKNNSNENSNTTSKKKESKDKSMKNSNKLIKSNSKNNTTSNNAANTDIAIDNKSAKSDNLFKGKILNSDDEKDIVIKT